MESVSDPGIIEFVDLTGMDEKTAASASTDKA
jgi:hypothetical protein